MNSMGDEANIWANILLSVNDQFFHILIHHPKTTSKIISYYTFILSKKESEQNENNIFVVSFSPFHSIQFNSSANAFRSS